MFMELTGGQHRGRGPGRTLEPVGEIRAPAATQDDSHFTDSWKPAAAAHAVTGRILRRVVGLDLASSGNEDASVVGRRLDQATLGGLPVPASTLLAPAQAQHFHL